MVKSLNKALFIGGLALGGGYLRFPWRWEQDSGFWLGWRVFGFRLTVSLNPLKLDNSEPCYIPQWMDIPVKVRVVKISHHPREPMRFVFYFFNWTKRANIGRVTQKWTNLVLKVYDCSIYLLPQNWLIWFVFNGWNVTTKRIQQLCGLLLDTFNFFGSKIHPIYSFWNHPPYY